MPEAVPLPVWEEELLRHWLQVQEGAMRSRPVIRRATLVALSAALALVAAMQAGSQPAAALEAFSKKAAKDPLHTGS